MCRVVWIGGREVGEALVATSRGYTCLSRHLFWVIVWFPFPKLFVPVHSRYDLIS